MGVEDSGQEVAEVSDWFVCGFPEPLKISEKQKLYLLKRLHLLEDILENSEQVALRFMGTEAWLDNLSKTSASAIIGKMKLDETRKERERIAKKAVKKKGAANVGRVCSSCGGRLSGDIIRTCCVCGKVIFYVEM